MRTADASAATVDAAAAMVSITRSRRDACSRTGSVGKPFMPDGNLFSLPPIRHASRASVHPLQGKAHPENGQWLREARQCWRLRPLRAIHNRSEGRRDGNECVETYETRCAAHH